MSTLQEITDPSSIRLDISASTWQEAMDAAGSLLAESGACGTAYPEAMIQTVIDKGPYIVIAPGFAFAHSRPTEDVTRTGMAWIRLQEPVAFGHSSNDPVSLIAALSATDNQQHIASMKQLSRLLGDESRRAQLDSASSPQEFYDALDIESAGKSPEPQAADSSPRSKERSASTKNKILTVCGNGLGTSLFLKNTLEQVLDHWGWSPYLTVEATDTISAKGKAKEADLILTSGEIARALGDLGVPVRVVENFTSMREIDAVMRDSYDI